MKIASWNVNSLNVRLPHVEQWLKNATPDVLGLQETKLEDARFPDTMLAELGYRSVFSGQKTYNGVALLAQQPLCDVQYGIPGFDNTQKRAIAATVGDLRLVNLYVVNGQSVGSDKYTFKLEWLDAVLGWLREELQRYPQLIVFGDFNIAPEDRDVYDSQLWDDEHILTSTAERRALRRLLDLGLTDSLRLHHSEAGLFSWWDYRQGGFRRNAGLRIDLLLVSEALRDRVGAAGIDREPRTWERPSDHTPVWIDIGDG